MRRKRVPSYLRRVQSRSHHHPLRFSCQTYVRPHVISSRKVQSAPTVHCTGQCEEKAPQRKSLQSLIFTQSGRRDLNPRPPEPHSGALPDCATSRCHFPGNPHPVNSPQAQTHRRTVGVQRRVSRTNSSYNLTPAIPGASTRLCVYASSLYPTP